MTPSAAFCLSIDLSVGVSVPSAGLRAVERLDTGRLAGPVKADLLDAVFGS